MTGAASKGGSGPLPHLVLFFTRNTSLAAWAEVGMLGRELALYSRLIKRGFRVTLVTYGRRGDDRHARSVPGIRVVCNRFGLSDSWYKWVVTTIYPLFWGTHVVFKSNQIQGADTAMQAAHRWGRPFVARCGYLHSHNTGHAHGFESAKAKKAAQLEQLVFRGAARVSVTTAAIADRISSTYGLNRRNIAIIPNYVDTELFSPGSNKAAERDQEGCEAPYRLIFVGRLSDEKNLKALLDAISGLNVELFIVGNDVLMEDLRQMVDARRLPVKFLGNLPNDQLPELLRSADLFVLPSLYEGHPKALLEAMACGTAALGTNVQGIRDVIRHGETGWLCGTSAEDLRSSIQQLLLDASLRRKLGEAARRYVVETCSLERIVEKEAQLLSDVARA